MSPNRIFRHTFSTTASNRVTFSNKIHRINLSTPVLELSCTFYCRIALFKIALSAFSCFPPNVLNVLLFPFCSNGQYIVAGSDDGSFFIWEKTTTNIVRVLRGDESIVNCLQPHPTSCLMATSGIDPVVRLWSPKPEVKTSFKFSSARKKGEMDF